MENYNYEPYKVTGATDINSLSYGTTEIQTGFNYTPTNVTSPPLPFFPPAVPKTQTPKTTTKISIKQNQISEPVYPNNIQTYENIGYEQYQTIEGQIYQTQYDINQSRQAFNAIDLNNISYLS